MNLSAHPARAVQLSGRVSPAPPAWRTCWPPRDGSIEGLDEVGCTSLVTGDLLRDAAVVAGPAVVAVALAATTLKRRTGSPTRAERRRRLAISLVVLALAAGIGVNVAIDASRYTATDNAIVDGE